MPEIDAGDERDSSEVYIFIAVYSPRSRRLAVDGLTGSDTRPIP